MFKLFFFQEPSPVPKRNTMAMLQGNTMILNHLPYPENPTWLPGKSRSWSLMYRLCSLFFPLKPPFMGRMFARGEGQGSSYGAHSVGTWRWWRRDAKLWIVLFFLFFLDLGILFGSFWVLLDMDLWPLVDRWCFHVNDGHVSSIFVDYELLYAWLHGLKLQYQYVQIVFVPICTHCTLWNYVQKISQFLFVRAWVEAATSKHTYALCRLATFATGGLRDFWGHPRKFPQRVKPRKSDAMAMKSSWWAQGRGGKDWILTTGNIQR